MGYVQIALAALLWATLGPVARVALSAGVDPLTLGFWRAALAGGLFGLHALVRGRIRVARRDWVPLAGFALAGVSVFYWSYFRAVELGGAALAAILLYTAPAWVALAAAAWLGERLTGRKAAALGLTLGGVVLVAAGGGDARVGGAAIAWGLVSGLSYAVYYLFGKHYFARYEAPTLFMYALPIGALSLAPAADFALPGPAAASAIALIAVVPTYGAYLLYSLGLRRIEATRAATVATLEPVLAAVAARIVWNERLGPWGTAGAFLVLAGVLVMTRAPDAPPPPHEGPAEVRPG